MRGDRAQIQAEAARGVPFDRMAVLLRSPQQYRAHLEEAFRRAGIDAYFERGTSCARIRRGEPSSRCSPAPPRELSASCFAEYLRWVRWPTRRTQALRLRRRAPPIDGCPADDELLPTAAFAPEEASAPEPEVLGDGPVVGGTLRAPRLWEKLLVDAAVIGGLRAGGSGSTAWRRSSSWSSERSATPRTLPRCTSTRAAGRSGGSADSRSRSSKISRPSRSPRPGGSGSTSSRRSPRARSGVPSASFRCSPSSRRWARWGRSS